MPLDLARSFSRSLPTSIPWIARASAQSSVRREWARDGYALDANEQTTLACAALGASGPREWVFDVSSLDDGAERGREVARVIGEANGALPPWPSVAGLILGDPSHGGWGPSHAAPPALARDDLDIRPAPDVVEVSVIEEHQALSMIDNTGDVIDVARTRRWVEAVVDPGPFRWRGIGPPSELAGATRSARMMARALRDAVQGPSLTGRWRWRPVAVAALWHHFATRGMFDGAHLAGPRFVIEPSRGMPMLGGERVQVAPGVARAGRRAVLGVIDSGSPPDAETARVAVLVRTSDGLARAQVDVRYADMISALGDAGARGHKLSSVHLNGFDFVLPDVTIAGLR